MQRRWRKLDADIRADGEPARIVDQKARAADLDAIAPKAAGIGGLVDGAAEHQLVLSAGIGIDQARALAAELREPRSLDPRLRRGGAGEPRRPVVRSPGNDASAYDVRRAQ